MSSDLNASLASLVSLDLASVASRSRLDNVNARARMGEGDGSRKLHVHGTLRVARTCKVVDVDVISIKGSVLR